MINFIKRHIPLILVLLFAFNLSMKFLSGLVFRADDLLYSFLVHNFVQSLNYSFASWASFRYLIWFPAGLFVKAFGYSELSFLGWPVLCYLGNILFLYLIGKRLFDEKAALLSAFFLAVVPLYVHYATQLLPDIIMPLFYLVAIYTLLRGVDAKEAKVARFWFFLAGLIAASTFNIRENGPVIFIPLICITILEKRFKKAFLYLFLGCFGYFFLAGLIQFILAGKTFSQFISLEDAVAHRNLVERIPGRFQRGLFLKFSFLKQILKPHCHFLEVGFFGIFSVISVVYFAMTKRIKGIVVPLIWMLTLWVYMDMIAPLHALALRPRYLSILVSPLVLISGYHFSRYLNKSLLIKIIFTLCFVMTVLVYWVPLDYYPELCKKADHFSWLIAVAVLLFIFLAEKIRKEDAFLLQIGVTLIILFLFITSLFKVGYGHEYFKRKVHSHDIRFLQKRFEKLPPRYVYSPDYYIEKKLNFFLNEGLQFKTLKDAYRKKREAPISELSDVYVLISARPETGAIELEKFFIRSGLKPVEVFKQGYELYYLEDPSKASDNCLTKAEILYKEDSLGKSKEELQRSLFFNFHNLRARQLHEKILKKLNTNNIAFNDLALKINGTTLEGITTETEVLKTPFYKKWYSLYPPSLTIYDDKLPSEFVLNFHQKRLIKGIEIHWNSIKHCGQNWKIYYFSSSGQWKLLVEGKDSKELIYLLRLKSALETSRLKFRIEETVSGYVTITRLSINYSRKDEMISACVNKAKELMDNSTLATAYDYIRFRTSHGLCDEKMQKLFFLILRDFQKNNLPEGDIALLNNYTQIEKSEGFSSSNPFQYAIDGNPDTCALASGEAMSVLQFARLAVIEAVEVEWSGKGLQQDVVKIYARDGKEFVLINPDKVLEQPMLLSLFFKNKINTDSIKIVLKTGSESTGIKRVSVNYSQIKKSIFLPGTMLTRLRRRRNQDSLSVLPPDKEKHIIYGPYENLCPGKYRVVYRLKLEGATKKKVCKIDVCTNRGEVIIKEKILKSNDFNNEGKFQDFVLDFDLPAPTKEIEYRVYYYGNAGLGVREITRERVGLLIK